MTDTISLLICDDQEVVRKGLNTIFRYAEGIEVVGGAHTPEEMMRFAQVARRRGLLASRASDFHGVEEIRVDLGGCNPLPQDLVPVWSRFCARAQVR